MSHVRRCQPDRPALTAFFAGQQLPAAPADAAAAALSLEHARGRPFTFLTVTNKGAQELNAARLRLEFPATARRLAAGEGLPCDPKAGGGKAVLEVGMRLRLTRNLDKERGFVNGNVAVVEVVLRKDVCVARTLQGGRLLVHPVKTMARSSCPSSTPTPQQCGERKGPSQSRRRKSLRLRSPTSRRSSPGEAEEDWSQGEDLADSDTEGDGGDNP